MKVKELWTKDVGPRWRWQTILLTGVLLFVVAITALTCTGTGAQGATLTRPVGITSGPITFDFTADQLSDAEAAKIIGGIGAPKQGPCWVFNQPDNPWHVDDYLPPHDRMYAWSVNSEWCSNPARTKVVSLVFNKCLDRGGYYRFDWCHKDKGSLGYESLGMFTDWHFSFNLPIGGQIDARHPQLDFALHSNGHVTGTVYYDN